MSICVDRKTQNDARNKGNIRMLYVCSALLPRDFLGQQETAWVSSVRYCTPGIKRRNRQQITSWQTGIMLYVNNDPNILTYLYDHQTTNFYVPCFLIVLQSLTATPTGFRRKIIGGRNSPRQHMYRLLHLFLDTLFNKHFESFRPSNSAQFISIVKTRLL